MPDNDKRPSPTNADDKSLAMLEELDQKISSALGFMMNLDAKLDTLLIRARLILIIVGGIAGLFIASRL